jgi:hypothetical protein
MSPSRTASPAITLNAAGWLCATFGILALLPNTGEAYIELPGRLLIAAAAVCWILNASRRGQ